MLQSDVLRFSVIADGRGAAAGMRSGVVNVTVRVLDVNDNRPIIVTAPSNGTDVVAFSVCAGARTDDRLLRVVARDADSGLNARLRYSLLDADNADDATASSSSTSYFSMDDADGWIVARRDLSRLAVGQKFLVTVVVSDFGRPPLSTNGTFLLTISDEDCLAAAAASSLGGRGTGSLRVLVIVSASVILLLLCLLIVVLASLKCRGRRDRDAEKKEAAGSGVVTERRWTDADGAKEVTAKQKLNTADKTSTLCFHHPADDAGISSSSSSSDSGARSCFNIQHEFEVVWQASSACYLRQVCQHFIETYSSYSANLGPLYLCLSQPTVSAKTLSFRAVRPPRSFVRSSGHILLPRLSHDRLEQF